MALTILIVDDEDHARKYIGDFLRDKGFEVANAATLAEARTNLLAGTGDVILLDVRLKDGYGPDLLYEISQMMLRPPVIMITAYPDFEMAVDAMRSGAHDFLPKPVDLNQLLTSIQRAGEIIAMRRELAHYRQAQKSTEDFIIGQTSELQMVVEHARKAAEVQVSVLITGETGTGKDVLARFIHQSGPRALKPFIPENCAAIQSTMLESELFGHEAGAFTSADKRKHGLMEVADGGILFLDEISSMGLDVQAKLLRATETKSIRRVGGTTSAVVDVQVIAASNRDLQKMIADGLFRQDLYYRLKVVDLHLPPLRERLVDIPELVGFFIRKFNSKMGKNVLGINPLALRRLMEYRWPGNIRELSNVIERALLFCDSEEIELAHLPSDIINSIK